MDGCWLCQTHGTGLVGRGSIGRSDGEPAAGGRLGGGPKRPCDPCQDEVVQARCDRGGQATWGASFALGWAPGQPESKPSGRHRACEDRAPARRRARMQIDHGGPVWHKHLTGAASCDRRQRRPWRRRRWPLRGRGVVLATDRSADETRRGLGGVRVNVVRGVRQGRGRQGRPPQQQQQQSGHANHTVVGDVREREVKIWRAPYCVVNLADTRIRQRGCNSWVQGRDGRCPWPHHHLQQRQASERVLSARSLQRHGPGRRLCDEQRHSQGMGVDRTGTGTLYRYRACSACHGATRPLKRCVAPPANVSRVEMKSDANAALRRAPRLAPVPTARLSRSPRAPATPATAGPGLARRGEARASVPAALLACARTESATASAAHTRGWDTTRESGQTSAEQSRPDDAPWLPRRGRRRLSTRAGQRAPCACALETVSHSTCTQYSTRFGVDSTAQARVQFTCMLRRCRARAHSLAVSAGVQLPPRGEICHADAVLASRWLPGAERPGKATRRAYCTCTVRHVPHAIYRHAKNTPEPEPESGDRVRSTRSMPAGLAQRRGERRPAATWTGGTPACWTSTHDGPRHGTPGHPHLVAVRSLSRRAASAAPSCARAARAARAALAG